MTSPLSELPNLGRYQVVDRIAAGGMAEVFLARAVGALGFQRLVALKLIHSNFTRDPEFVKMFFDEARIAMHLHHRNIVQVFDLDEVAGTYFLAMEYVKGVNLYDLYERIAAHDRWIEVPLALYVVAEVCKGLHFAHTRTGSDGRPLGIIHRDISPQNILLSFEGEVKITDFGIATAAERLHQTAAGIVKGKYAYMAPERLQEKPADARVDVFSAGVLLYELLVGENPFAGASAVDTIEAVLSRDVPAPSARGAPSPKRLDAICLRALARDPNARYPSAQALADDLAELAMGLTYARRDMASGDAAVAQLLAELFPEARARPAGAGAAGGAPRASASEGLDAATAEVDAAARPDDLDDEDLDAPTVLRSSPLASDLDDGQVHPPAGGGDAPTGPTELPGVDATLRMSPVSAPVGAEDDPYASTAPAGVAETTEMPAVSPRAGAWPTSRPPVPFSPSRPAVAADPAETADPATRTPPAPSGVGAGPLAGGPASDSSSSADLVTPTGGPSWRPGLLAALLALVVVAGGAVVAFALGSGAEQVIAVPVTLRSEPSGARVLVDGRALPSPTPTTTHLLAGASADLRFELEGHRPASRRVVPDARQATEVFVALEPLPRPPPLTARPVTREVTLRLPRRRQARIFREGEELGRAPLTVELPVGEVTLEVALEGRRRREVQVDIPAEGPSDIRLAP